MRDFIVRLGELSASVSVTVGGSELVDDEAAASLDEAPRKRRTAYRSGRLELIGYKVDVPGKEKRTSRKVSREGKRKGRSPLNHTPFKGNFRWKKG